MKKALILISSLTMVAIVAGSVFAWGPGRGYGMGYNQGQNCPGYGGPGYSNQTAYGTELTQAQQDELAALRQKFVDDTYETRSAMFQKRQEMRMLMETSSPDKAKLTELSQQISDLQKQLRDGQIDYQLAAKKIAPELNMGAGFGRGKWGGRGGSRGGYGGGFGCGNF